MRNTLIARLWQSLVLELRFSLGHWSMWLLFVIWIVFSYTNIRDDASVTAQSLFLNQYSYTVSTILSLGILILSAVSAIRANRIKFDLLEKSYPVGAEIWLGRWGAMMTIGMIFLVPPIIIAMLQGIDATFLPALLTFLHEQLVMLGALSALVFFIHVVIGGIKRWTFILLVMIWVASFVLPSVISPQVLPAISLVGFSSVASNGFYYSTLWGRLSAGQLAILFTWVYLGLTALFMGVTVFIVQRRRLHRTAWASSLIAIAGLSLAVYGIGVYQVRAQQAFEQNRITPYYTSGPVDALLPAELDYYVSAYDITLDLSDDPQYTVALTVVNRGDTTLDTLQFSLNGLLEIASASVPYERNAEDILFTLDNGLAPEDSLTIEIVYHGDVVSYLSFAPGRAPALMNFAQDDGVNLACEIAWYPVPGDIIVGRAMPVPDCYLDVPATFRVTITGNDRLQYASNLPTWNDGMTFTSESAVWAHIIGAPRLESVQVDTVRLIAPASEINAVQTPIMTHFRPALEHTQTFFDDVTGLNVFMVGWLGNGSNQQTEGVLMAEPQSFYLDDMQSGTQSEYYNVWYAVVRSVYDGTHTDVARNVAYFVWIHYLADGDPSQMATLMAETPPSDGGAYLYSPLPHEDEFALAFTLYDIYVTDGEDAVRDAMYILRDNLDQLRWMSVHEVSDWVVQP